MGAPFRSDRIVTNCRITHFTKMLKLIYCGLTAYISKLNTYHSPQVGLWALWKDFLVKNWLAWEGKTNGSE